MTIESTVLPAVPSMKPHRLNRDWSPHRIMVCISSNPEAPRLVRRGQRLAAGLGARLYAVYVEMPFRRPTAASVRNGEVLARNLSLAQSAGATVVRVTAARTVDGLIEFARREGMTHVILGQTQRSRWEILLHGSVLDRFLEEVPDVAVQVITRETNNA